MTFLILPLQAQAAISQAQLKDLELNLWKIRSDFHMYTVMAGNQTYEVDLNGAISAADSALSDLAQNASGETENQLVTALQRQWKALRKAAQGNTIASQGYTDAYTIQDVNDIPVEMSEKMEAFDQASTGKYDDVRELAVSIEHMTSEYLNIAADPAGGMAAGSDEGRLSFKEAVPEFEKKLAAAKKAHAGDDAMTRALNQVSVKWQFIRQSMIKFYENAVPFLIYRYTNQMVGTLEQAIQLASTDVGKPTFGPVN
ncbi:hypothetical protein [Alcanivorax hongdengensis]|uniref:hypothetical protein n=1 Tax=Alcanivorax hongdengensis TaxID=519051 RepID=UPI001ED9A11D|nr:hypothetical protein [Alcanivorax hongdengensis]